MSVILSAALKNANGQPQNGRRNRSAGWSLPRSCAGAVHSVPPDGGSPRADGRSMDIPDLLSQLIERVEVGRKYQVTIKLNMEYQQFLEITEEQKLIPLISA